MLWTFLRGILVVFVVVFFFLQNLTLFFCVLESMLVFLRASGSVFPENRSLFSQIKSISEIY